MAEYARPEVLVEPEWLAEHLHDPDIRIVDARGAARYQEAHIPGAVNLPVARLDDPSAPVRSTLLPAERFAAVVGGYGIGTDQHVVVYDDGQSLMAARVFWALEYYGHPRVSVLNGGIAYWASQGRELSTAPVEVQPATFKAEPHPERGATKAEVLERLNDPSVALLDVRSRDEYTGAVAQAMRGGRIPGAKWREWSDSLVAPNRPLFKPADQLQQQFAGAGITPDKEVITYCQGGVRAAHSYFALRLLGYDRVRNYTGSWGDWGNDPSTPIEQGQ